MRSEKDGIGLLAKLESFTKIFMHDELVTECIIFHALVKLRNPQYVTV